VIERCCKNGRYEKSQRHGQDRRKRLVGRPAHVLKCSVKMHDILLLVRHG